MTVGGAPSGVTRGSRAWSEATGVGRSRKRVMGTGAIRYTAYYQDLRGRRRSTGIFASKKAADAAWRNA